MIVLWLSVFRGILSVFEMRNVEPISRSELEVTFSIDTCSLLMRGGGLKLQFKTKRVIGRSSLSETGNGKCLPIEIDN